jgi:hypothetical protein
MTIPPMIHTNINDGTRNAAGGSVAAVDRLRAAWALEKALLDGAVAHANATKSGLPDGYWKAEHDARRRLDVAEAVVESFKDG